MTSMTMAVRSDRLGAARVAVLRRSVSAGAGFAAAVALAAMWVTLVVAGWHPSGPTVGAIGATGTTRTPAPIVQPAPRPAPGPWAPAQPDAPLR
jgi:hypothetical protein